ncbi:MAG: protein-disulfide isomerase [Acidimicrobiales bacterium]
MTTRRTFAVTWDYRCPFARNAHEHVLAGLRAGAPWDVTFVPFSLGQVHVAEGEPDIWGRWQEDSGLLALQAGVVVRDKFPDRFLDTHEALFALRHDHGGHLRDEQEVRRVLEEQSVDADAVLSEIEGGGPIAVVAAAHQAAAKEHAVWGVPTFIQGDRAVFVRYMDRPGGDGDRAIRSIERTLDLLEGWPELNEFKHTSIPR